MANNDSDIELRCDTQITVTSAEPNVKNSLIVVSNRLPFVLKKSADGKMSRQARWVKFDWNCTWDNMKWFIASLCSEEGLKRLSIATLYKFELIGLCWYFFRAPHSKVSTLLMRKRETSWDSRRLWSTAKIIHFVISESLLCVHNHFKVQKFHPITPIHLQTKRNFNIAHSFKFFTFYTSSHLIA